MHSIRTNLLKSLSFLVIDGERIPWYAPDILEKFFWRGLAEYSYEAVFLINGFTYSGADQTHAMAELLNGSSYTEAACNWVKSHEANWAMWVAPGT